MWTAATHLLIYIKNTQKSIENMNFELRSSILPQVQSLLKPTFSTYNILPKLKNIFSITFKILKMTVYINELAKAYFFFFFHILREKKIEHTVFRFVLSKAWMISVYLLKVKIYNWNSEHQISICQRGKVFKKIQIKYPTF